MVDSVSTCPDSLVQQVGRRHIFNLIVDPTAAYENKPDWKSTLHASAGLVIDVLKESSDVFTPLKSVAGGLFAILKHYNVRCVYFVKYFIPLTFDLANDGEP